MQRKNFVVILFAIALSGAEYNSVASPCNSTLPTWAYTTQSECNKKTLQYSKDAEVFPLLGGQTSLNYDFKQNMTTDIVSMGAQYLNDQFTAKIQGSYAKERFDNAPSVGKTNLTMQYRQKLWNSLALNASENISIPLKTAYNLPEPMKYTSMLKALYPLTPMYNMFAEGSYSYVDSPTSESAFYRNGYSYMTGIVYSDDWDTSINASYVTVQDADPTLGPHKKIKLAHKQKINKKIKTSLSVTKILEAEQPDDQATFNVIYAF